MTKMFLGFAVGKSSQKANTQKGIKQQSVRFCELSQMFLETVNKVLNDISLLLSFLFYNDDMNGDTRFSNELLRYSNQESFIFQKSEMFYSVLENYSVLEIY